MKKYQLIITIGVVVIVGFTAVRAAWFDPQTVPGQISSADQGVYIPVNSGNSHQIKTQGIGIGGGFIAVDDAQFDQGVFVPGVIRGGDPIYSNPGPSTVSFGGPNNEVGIEANGTFYVRDEIATPSLATGNNTVVKQVCADQYGFLSLCQ